MKIICKICGKKFEKGFLRRRIYCSKKCLTEARLKTKKMKICKLCQKEFYPPYNTRGFFCSRKCSNQTNTKASSVVRIKNWKLDTGGHMPNWRGGLPKCPDCGGEKKNMYAKRCRRCFLGYKGMSGLEKRVEKIINKHKLPYRFVGDGKFMIEKKCPDFVNTNGEKKVIEVFWMAHKNKFRKGGFEGWKQDREEVFGKYGWKVIYIEGSTMNESKVLKEVASH